MTTISLHRRHDPFRPPEAPGLGRGMLFALAAHILLVVAISINVQWRTKTLPTAEAELWSTVPVAAAPKEVLPPPEPEPEVKPTPKVQQPPQPSPAELQAQRDAEIAIAKQKEQKRKEAERQAELEEQKRQKALKDKADKLEKEKADKLEKQRAEDKAKADKEKADKADKDKQLKAQKADDARREAQRQENLKRMMGMAGASGDANATGRAQKSAGPSASYGGRIVARVKPNIVYADNPAGNPAAEVEVKIAPDGTIIGRKLVKSSGLPEFDNAVLRAIDKTEVLPRDVDGSVPPSLVITFRPKDL
ncbi:cell envelope integrity protein TolA [Pelomonas sp. KK5]|uniref:cell envelope integrity protein TolA n=1 Tax=Pelomonas sp. KK5 TaxID=1855730 RepID=UPI001E305165|nr:cell envelope integrity protein TolA [Pelomonas sp. KK5]